LVLHEMATGHRALGAEESDSADTPSTGANSRVVNPWAVTPTPPRGLQAIVARALENDPARRFQAASEMLGDLGRARVRVHRPMRWHARSVLAVALLMVLMASGLWLWLRRTRPVVRLAPDDTLVLAHLTNQTADRMFDDALYLGLEIALDQTPYLN